MFLRKRSLQRRIDENVEAFLSFWGQACDEWAKGPNNGFFHPFDYHFFSHAGSKKRASSARGIASTMYISAQTYWRVKATIDADLAFFKEKFGVEPDVSFRPERSSDDTDCEVIIFVWLRVPPVKSR